MTVCLQDVLSEVDDDRLIPDATRDAVLALYEEIQGPTPSTLTPATNRSLATESHEENTDQANPDDKTTEDPNTDSGINHEISSVDGNEDGPNTSLSTKSEDIKENCKTKDESTIQEKKAPKCWMNTRGSEGDFTLPNLHHLVKLTEALRRNTRILNLTVGQAGSFVYFEATRAFGGLFESEEDLCNRVLKIIRKHFKEVEEHLAWWPGVTEEGRRMMMHSKDYSEFLKNVQYPDGMKQTMFTNAHFSCLLKLVLTMETVNGHAIILGPPGVGKMALTKLAAYYTRARVYHLDDIPEEAGRLGVLRAAMEASGVTGRRTILLLRQHSLTPIILDILYSVAQHGWSKGLWTPLRERGLLEAIRAKGKDPPQENRWMTYLEEEDLTALKHRFITSIKRNLHICLLAHSETLVDDWCEKYPSIRSKWFWMKMENWGPETLRQVARKILLPAELPPHILHQLKSVFPKIHMLLAQQENMTVTVSDFVEACQVTVRLLSKRRAQLRDSLALFKGGMDKLQETSASADELKGELSELEPELKATQEEGQRLTHALVQKRNQVTAIREQMIVQEEKVKEKCEAVNTMNDDIMQEVGEALPGLEAGEKGIKGLDKKDLVEVRVLNKPPDLVLAVMEPICLLLNVKLDWTAMKTLLGDPTMTKRLLEVDKDNISDATHRKIQKYTSSSKFVPDEVAKVSKPCKPLCAWLKALDHYAQVLRNIEPKKIKLVDSERDLNTLQLEQRQLQQQLGQCERELSELQARYEACVCRRQQLEGGIKRATARLQRCTRLTTVLADEDSRWSAKIKTLMVEAEGVYGECAVSGVAVAYFGSLEPAYRENLRRLVIRVLLEGGVVTPSKHELVDTLTTSEVKETWEDAGLYRDPSCFLQAAFVFSAVRRTLVLDPDFVCTRFLTKLYEETGGMQVLHAGDEGVVSKVVAAAHAQKPILVLQTPTHLTYNLRKILQIPQVIQAPDGGVIEVKIVLVTGDAAPVLPQDLCVYVTRISFALPPLVLEERLLNDVLKMERSDLFDQQSNLSGSIARDRKSLDAVDDTILKKLTQAATSLLDNEELLAAFYEAKSTSAEFRARLAECQRTLQKIGNVRDKYRPVATRGRLLFSTSTALRRINSSYVFSFQHFIHLFSLCITSGGQGEALSFDQRISSLVESVTQLVVNHISRALHPNHRLAFITALCAAVASNEGQLTPPAWRVILHPSRYEEREALESVLGLDEEFDLSIKDLLEGKRLLVNINNLVMEVGLLGSKGRIEAPRGRISDFNALMLLRLTKPQMMMAGARELVNCMLGDPSLHKPELALTKLLGSDERKYPVLVRSDYGRDVAGEVLAAALTRGLAGITRVIMPTTSHKVNPLEKVGTAHLSTVLLNAIQQGGWIVVQGAESPAVLPTLLEAMTNLASPDVKVQEDFRLVVTVSVADECPCDLTLLARPVHLQPASTFLATLSAISALINHHHYRHHYLGVEWRKAIWKAAAVHTISTVCRYWQAYPKASRQPSSSTLTPRTQVASIKSQSSQENPSPFDSSLQLERGTEAPGRPREGGGAGLDGHINLGEISTTFSYLYNLSLSHPLSDDTLQSFLGVTYGGEDTWSEVISSMPEEVGVVSREAAVSIVGAHIASCLQSIHSLAMDVEYENFQKDLEAITQAMFDKPPEQEPEEEE
ncbi:dynein axonemal heavy chain 6-like [Palaemon carinicauda]|uniref:dynein axonemal heavy chain 6-like n=1 Tax=Palaemon carinicauda TaxID=392227 RepID=UPI0035B6212E